MIRGSKISENSQQQFRDTQNPGVTRDNPYKKVKTLINSLDELLMSNQAFSNNRISAFENIRMKRED
jgi:hypothetical protein